MNYKEYCEAYKQANHQYACHSQQVSGVWSISGKEFCERYKLDYDRAIEYETEAVIDEFDDYYAEEATAIRRKIGELTEKQERTLQEHCEDNFYFDEEGEHFWWYVKSRLLAEAYPEYDERYYKDKEFKG